MKINEIFVKNLPLKNKSSSGIFKVEFNEICKKKKKCLNLFHAWKKDKQLSILLNGVWITLWYVMWINKRRKSRPIWI